MKALIVLFMAMIPGMAMADFNSEVACKQQCGNERFRCENRCANASCMPDCKAKEEACERECRYSN